jgi:hypothetical protein
MTLRLRFPNIPLPRCAGRASGRQPVAGHWLVVAGLLGCPVLAAAQSRFSLVAEGQLHRSYSRFRGNSLVSHRVDVFRMSGRAASIGGQYKVSDKLAVKLVTGLFGHGLAFQTYADAPGGRWYEARGTSRTFSLSFKGGLSAVYVLSPSNKKHRWLTEAGVEVITDASPFDFRQRNLESPFVDYSFDITGGARSGPPFMEAQVRITRGAVARPGLYLAAGHEWQLGRRHYMASRLVGCIGLVEKRLWRLNYTVWDVAPDVDPVSYQNEVSTNISWVGVQASYRFSL